MSKAPLGQPAPSSEATTVMHPQRQTPAGQASAEPINNESSLSPASFAEVEGPTLSSPSLNSDSKLSTMAALECRIEALETRLAAAERELAEVYGAVEHVVKGQETVDQHMRQQRFSRYLVWGTLIVILVVFWMTLQARLGNVLPH